MRKKQIINSTVANRDGPEKRKDENSNAQKALRLGTRRMEENNKKRPTCPLTNLLMYSVNRPSFLCPPIKAFYYPVTSELRSATRPKQENRAESAA